MNCIQILIQQGWRPITSKRARKLKKRGERVQWVPAFNSLAWLPDGMERKS